MAKKVLKGLKNWIIHWLLSIAFAIRSKWKEFPIKLYLPFKAAETAKSDPRSLRDHGMLSRITELKENDLLSLIQLIVYQNGRFNSLFVFTRY